MADQRFEISFLLDFYGDLLTDKQREAVDLYYNQDFSLFEISQHAGITRQGVRDNIKRGEQILLNMEEKLGLAEKFRQQAVYARKIRECAALLREYGTRRGLPGEILAGIDTIINLTDSIQNV